MTQDLVDYSVCMKNNCSDPIDLEDSMTTVAIWYIGLAAGNFLFSWLGIGLFGYSAERQVHKMRLALFRNAIHQEIGWFDSHSSGEILSRLSQYVILFLNCMPIHYFYRWLMPKKNCNQHIMFLVLRTDEVRSTKLANIHALTTKCVYRITV